MGGEVAQWLSTPVLNLQYQKKKEKAKNPQNSFTPNTTISGYMQCNKPHEVHQNTLYGGGKGLDMGVRAEDGREQINQETEIGGIHDDGMHELSIVIDLTLCT